MKYIIKWDAGYGNQYDEVEADNYDEAMRMAERCWEEEVANNADYDVVGEWTEELAEEYL